MSALPHYQQHRWRRRWQLAGCRRVRPGVGDMTNQSDGHTNGDPLIINALIESEWQQTWSA